MKYRSPSGFTLVELIVVTVIIGMLTTIGVVSYRYVIDETRTTTATSNINDVITAIESARTKSGKPLKDITGNNCSHCGACNTGTSLKDVDDTHLCVQRWENVVESVSAVSAIDLSNIRRDPWGSPYIVDENDGEYSTDLCRRDSVRSAGPDGIMSTTDDIVMTLDPISRGCE